MPRREIPFLPHHYYHIYNRGNNRETIFFEKDNYLFFVSRMRNYISPAADVIAYCLMPTHYHLLVRVKTSEVRETSEVSLDLSKAMMRLSVSYTKAINKRFQRVGVLFQGAFQAKQIENDAHLRHLCRYIHANPVKDGLVAAPDDWPYSNYREWMGQRDGKLVDHNFIQAQFTSPEDYQAFVFDYLRIRSLPDGIKIYLAELER